MREIEKRGNSKMVAEQRGIDYYMQLAYSVLLHEIEDDGEKYWIAEVVELPGCKSHGSTVSEAVKNVEEAKRAWIMDSLERGEEIPLPIERERFKGKTLVRMSRSLHRALALIAQAEGVSLNQLIVNILAKQVGQFNISSRVEDKIDELRSVMSSQLELRTFQQYIWSYLDIMSRRAGEDLVLYNATDDDSLSFQIRSQPGGVVGIVEPMFDQLLCSGRK
jgi:antitoxin HicB